MDDLILTLLDASQSRHPGVGLGEDIRFASRHIEGAALVHKSRVVHLCAFPSEQLSQDSAEEADRQLAGPKRRRQLLRGY